MCWGSSKLKAVLSLITILFLITSSIPFGFADVTYSVTPVIDDSPIVSSTPKETRNISVSLNESVGIASNSPQKKTSFEKPLIMSESDRFGKMIHLSESLDINPSMLEQTVQLNSFIPQQPVAVERTQSDKLKDRKKNSKLDLLLVEETIVQPNSNTEILSPLNISPIIYDPTSFLNNNIDPINLDLLFDEKFFEETTLQFFSTLDQLTTFDVSQTTQQYFLVLLVPLTFFLLIRSEDLDLELSKLHQPLAFVFALIIISGGVITPFSIGEAYWPMAYADNSEIDTHITSSEDSASSSSTPAEDTESSDSTSDNTSTPVDSASSSSTPAEDVESTGDSSSTHITSSEDSASSSSTPAEDTESSDSTSDNTSTPVDSASSSSTPAEDVESTGDSSSTHITSSEDSASSSSTPAEDTESSDSTSDNTSTPVDSASSSSTPAEDVESTGDSSSNQELVVDGTLANLGTNTTTTEVIPTNTTTTEVIPTNTTTTEVIPTNTTTTEVIPTNTTTTEVIPTNTTTTEVIPTNTTTTEVIPTNTTTTEVIPGTNSTEIPVNGTVIPGTNSTEIPVNGTVIPGTNSTEIPVNGTVIPGTNSTEIPVNGTVIPGTNSTEIPVNGTVIPGTNSTEIPVNGTVIPGTNSTEIPVNGTVIPGTNSTEIPVNGTVIPGTNSTEIPIIVPNATESWQFDTQVNGSHFIGDVYIESTNSSLILDGDGYVTNDGNSTSDLSNISVTAWVNPDYDGGSAEFTVISKEKAFSLTINNNIAPQHIATFSVFDGIKWHSVETVDTLGENWSHIAATFNGTILSIYTNGTLSNTNESVEKIELTIDGQLEAKTIETVTSTSDIIIGATLENQRTVDDVTKKFHGEIKEVNIFDVYLTAQQIQEIYLDTLPLIQQLYNKTTTEIIEEEKELVAIDILAQRDLENTNATSIDTTNATNIDTTNATSIDTTNATDTSITFNTTESYIPIEDESLNEELNKLTISTWIHPEYDSGSAEYAVVSKENSFVLGINNIYAPERVPTFSVFDGITWTEISGTTEINDWANLVAVINNTRISLYLNGQLEATTLLPESFVLVDGEISPVSADVAENNSDLIIGAYLSTLRDQLSLSNHFAGTIDDVLIYKEALSEAQISEIYAGYVAPPVDNSIPFEEHLLSFSDNVTVFVNGEEISDIIHVAPIDIKSPTTIQAIGFTDYVTYTINGNTNESSVEVISIEDVVVATIIPNNSTQILGNVTSISEVISIEDVVVATIIPNNSTQILGNVTSISEVFSFNDVIVVSLNATSLINLYENLSIDSSSTLGDSITLNNTITTEIQLEHDSIEINKPVIWTHDIIVSNDTESLAVEIPADAEILSVKTINDTSETILFNSTDYVVNDYNYTGLYDDQDISEKDLKKYFRLIDSVQTIESKINETNEKIAYYADLDTAKAHKKLDKLESKLDKLEERLEKKLDKISDTVPLASLQTVKEKLQEDKPLKVLLLNETDSNVELTFMTPAPYTLENDNSTNDKFDKKVTVAHESALHYTNVTAFSELPEDLVKKDVDFRLFWNINNTRVDVTDDPRFAVKFVDTDQNLIADQMQWTVPQLSEQEFDVEADLQILNVQSYPAVGGTWKVKFTTNGTADLVITAINGTTFGTESPDDLQFLELNNGTHTLTPIVNGNTITYHNYSSTGEGYEESTVLTPFKHVLMFQFGNKTSYAQNSAFVPNGPKAILLYGDPIVLGSPTVEDDLAVTSPIIPGWDELADRQDSIFVHSPTGDGCNGPADSCTEIQVTEAGTYRVSYGLTAEVGTITAGRWSAVSFVQNTTEFGSYNNDEGMSCFDSSYRRSGDDINTVTFAGECLLDLAANDRVRVGVSRTDNNAGDSGLAFAADENWFNMQKVENPTISLLKDDASLSVTDTHPLTFVDAEIVTYDTSTFTFDGSSANAEITVDEDGFYKVSYSGTWTDTGSRAMMGMDIQTGNSPTFASSEYGGSSSYGRDRDGYDQSGLSSSAILELSAGDEIRIVAIDESGDDPILNAYHVDVEFIGPASSANVLRIHNSTGGVDMYQTDLAIKWDTSDEEGSHFTFTGDTTPTDEITVQNNGIYHISYGIESLIDGASNGEKYGQKTKLQIDSGSGYNDANACYGVGFGRHNPEDRIVATSGCMLELEIGDKIRIVSSQVADPNTGTVTSVADKSFLTIHSLTISNPPLEESLGFSDSITAILIKNLPEILSFVDVLDTDLDATVSLTESLSLNDSPVTVTSAGTIQVGFVEALSLSDDPITNLILPIKPIETLSLSDVMTFTKDGVISLSETLSFSDVVTGEPFVPSNPDFKVQQGVFVMSGGSATATLTEGTDFDQCTGDCFIMQVSTRHTGMGRTSGGGNQNVDDTTVYISDDSGLNAALGTITFTRQGTAIDNRIAWQIIEYIGPENGPNEMKVLETGTINMPTSTANSEGTVISGGASDDNDVAVIITGVSNHDTGRSQVPSQMVTTEWKGASNVAVFNRTAANDETDLSYAVVEWSGKDWNLQRITHEGSDIGSEQTESITDVGDLSRAFVLQAQQRNAGLDTDDGTCEVGERVHLSATDELTFKHEVGADACTYTSDMQEVVWVLSNTNTQTGKKMIVEHQQPNDQVSTTPTEEDNWQRTISSLTYGTDETSILGFTANADDFTINNPRGTLVATLTDSNTVDFWQSDASQEVIYSFSVVQWPRSSALSVAFVESLSLSDNLEVPQEESDSLSFVDSVVAIKAARSDLSESLSLQDAPVLITSAGTINVSFEEDLSLVDSNAEILVQPIVLTESLGFSDVVSVIQDSTITLSESLSFNDNVENEAFVQSNPDYKIQHGTFAMTGATGTITEGVDFDQCTGDCFIMQVSTRNTGMGTTSGGGEQNVDDVTTYISNIDGLFTASGTVTFTRVGTTNDNRIAWQIVEYIGPAGGPNEMKVLGNGTVSFAGTAANAQTSTISNVGDDNDVAVLITGISGDATGSDDYDTVLVTSEWKGASDVAVFNRTATGSVGLDVSYAVVEFSGVSWNLQRVEHEGVDAPSPIQTEPIEDVGDLSRAFILQAQQRNADGGGADGPCETGEVVWLSDTDTLSFTHEHGSVACDYDSDMNEVIWVLSNTNSETGKKMIVEHQQAIRLTGGSEEDNWQRTIDTLTYGTDETSIFGFTANPDDVNNAEHPHGTVVAELTDNTTVDLWHSDSGEELGYAFSVVQWPRSRVFSIDFVESLSLSDNASFNIKITLSESLSFNDGNVESPKTALVQINESLSLQDTINKEIPVSLTESLTLADLINRNIPVSLDESLSLVDNINRNIPVSLTESLSLVDNINRNISVSLTESLSLADLINRNIPVLLDESLSLADNINRNIPVSLDESLSLVDNINRVIPVSLDESLSLADNINRNIPVSLTESLTLADLINRNVPVTLTETLDLADNINRNIPVSLDESLSLVDNINRNIPVSLTESLTLADLINRNVPVTLTESLSLADNINRNIPVSLDESLSLVDNINRNIPVSLTETLDLADNINRNIPVSLTESLTLADLINRNVPVTLTETLDLADNINRNIPVSITESLTLADNINRNIPVSLTESLSLADNINRNIPVSLTESLTLADLINRNVPVTLTESLSLADNINRNIPVSLDESLSLVDNINRNIPVSLTETLDLADNINRNIPVSLDESLSLVDNINRVIPVSLDESLSLADNINRNIPVSLTESLTLADLINRNVPVTLTETLDLADNINRNIPVSLDESLSLVDNINRNIPVSLTESLTLADLINRNVPVTLTESLSLADNINRNIPVSLDESLSLVDNINRNIPVSLTETLDLADNINRNIPVSLTESLTLADLINRNVPVTLTETLDLADNINRNIPVSITESLTLADNINRNIPVSLTESLSLADNINRNIPVSLTESLTLADLINRNVPVTLTESLSLADNINRNIPVSLDESLSLVDNINRNIPVSLTETLDLADNINRNIPVSLTESLTLADLINRNVPVTLTETLDLADNINRNIPVSITESLTLADNINRNIPVSLTESLSLADNINRNIPVSLTESLTLADLINRNVPVTLTESLSLADNINRNIPVSLDESLSLVDNINRNIPVSLTESLSLADNINRNIPVSLTESLTLADLINRNVPVSLTESLSLADNINRNIPVSLTESLSLADNINRNIPVSLTESLSLADNINRNIPVSLTESLSLADNINRNIPVSLTESLSLADNINRNIPVSLTESLTLADNINRNIPVSLTESLTLADNINRNIPVSLTESLSLADNINRNIPVSLTESLSLADNINRNIPVSITESLTLADNINRNIPVSLTESLSLADNINRNIPVSLTESLTLAD